jgi:hypothetical protein
MSRVKGLRFFLGKRSILGGGGKGCLRRPAAPKTVLCHEAERRKTVSKPARNNHRKGNLESEPRWLPDPWLVAPTGGAVPPF